MDKILRKTDQDNKHTSYINSPWTEMYLRDRRPVAFTHTPGLGVNLEHDVDLLQRVSTLLISGLRFHQTYKHDKLTPDVYHLVPAKTNNMRFWSHRVRYMPDLIATHLCYLFKVFPLDMSQSPYLLQSTRIPRLEADILERFPQSKHVLVLFKGHLYTFDVYDEDDRLFKPEYYFSCIKSILEDRPLEPCDGVGVLTAGNRDNWARLRKIMEEDLGNGDVFHQVDSALFAICIDDWVHGEDTVDATNKNLVVGPNPANRWYDKSISMMVSQNGLTGFGFEHSWGDGVAVMRFIDEIVKDIRQNPIETPSRLCDSDVKRLHFNLDGRVRHAIREANQHYQDRLDEIAFSHVRIQGFGKADCKKAGLGPDSIMQLAIQVANHRINGSFSSTYESCSTAIFRHGRTETIRPATMETRAFCEAIHGRVKPSDQDLFTMLKDCSRKHSELTLSAAKGRFSKSLKSESF